MPYQKKIKRLTVNDFERCFCSPVSEYVRNQINKYDFSYYEVSEEEHQKIIISCLEALKKELKVCGSHRKDEWQQGWSENWNIFKYSGNINDLFPKYYTSKKDIIVRFDGKFIRPKDANFELYTQQVIISHITELFLSDVTSIYDFGCGTAKNFLPISAINKSARLIGADWAPSSGKIIERLRETQGINCDFHLFNFFEPDKNLKIKPNSAIITVTALEQIGENFDKFLNYLIENRPRLCVHVEPIVEFLEPDRNLLDYCMYQYMIKRNYLNGLYKKLKNLEKDGIIEIIEAKRVNFGGFWTEGTSVIAWKVK